MFEELEEEVRLAHLAPALNAPFPGRGSDSLSSVAASVFGLFGFNDGPPPSVASRLDVWLNELCLRAELDDGKPHALPHKLRCTLANPR